MRGLERGSAAPPPPPPLLLTLFALIVSDRINYRTVNPSRGKNRKSWNTCFTFSSPQKNKTSVKLNRRMKQSIFIETWLEHKHIHHKSNALCFKTWLPNWTDRRTSSVPVWCRQVMFHGRLRRFPHLNRFDLLIRCIMWFCWLASTESGFFCAKIRQEWGDYPTDFNKWHQ